MGSTVDVHALRSGRAVMELPLDAVFTVLAARRRRVLLRVLRDADACRLDDVVEGVAARERQLDGTAPGRDPLRSELERVDLSILADHRILDHDERGGGIRYYGHRWSRSTPNTRRTSSEKGVVAAGFYSRFASTSRPTASRSRSSLAA